MNDIQRSFEIVRLAGGDVRAKTDHLRNFENLVLANESYYPAIAQWYRQKVLPGIRDDERVAFVGYLENAPVISAVVKKGADAKFCHLRISQDLQNSNLGELFFTIMALEIRDLAQTIHFTLPESLWQSKAQFFQSFGFESAKIAETQYRLFDRELRCYGSFSNVWRSALDKLPKLSHLYTCGGFSPDNRLLLSIKPEHAEQIVAKKKTVEIRRKFSTRWIGQKINLYASAPVMSLIGEATIARIVVKDSETIWERYKERVGCSRHDFDLYAQNSESLYAIELEDVKTYRARLPLTQMSRLVCEHLVPPQSYCTLEKNRPWAKAISIAAYLHGCVRSKMSFASTQSLSAQIAPKSPRQTEFKLR